ncbi:MAG: membrane protein insertase YidC [Candidatus Paceibacterota bacterium]|jgi:YidC/Oxa1 family membrane protein insertase
MYTKFIFLPLYNGLVGIMDLLPGIDVGVAVIIFTIIIRIILFPLSKSSLLTQVRMKEVEPEAAKIRAQYSTDKQQQALKIMELYKQKKIKPFSGILLLIIQLPILLALISVFYKIIPTIDPTLLYSFISPPVVLPTLLGLDLTQKSIILSLITALAQYLQMHFSVAMRQQKSMAEETLRNGGTLDKASQLSHSMNKQMKFMLPVVAFASTYWLIPAQFPQAASIIAIYWSVSAFATLLQELYIRKKYLQSVKHIGNNV